jgi:hypothetical protein
MAISNRDGIDGVAGLFDGEGPRRPEGSWDGRCRDPGLEMFKAAYHLAVEMGLRAEAIPDLRTENGVLHAYMPTGTKIKLELRPGWEEESGYAGHLSALLQQS